MLYFHIKVKLNLPVFVYISFYVDVVVNTVRSLHCQQLYYCT